MLLRLLLYWLFGTIFPLSLSLLLPLRSDVCSTLMRLTQALNGDVSPSGVPQHLRSAYGGGKLIPAGQIIVMRGEVESVQEPEWWNQDSVMGVMDHVCEKLVSQRLFVIFSIFANVYPRDVTLVSRLSLVVP